jgi:heme/copper-type cytochrome/quinol oxidase subunit 3
MYLNTSSLILILSLIGLSFIYLHWWSLVGIERQSGEHRNKITDGLKVGILIFILREVFFFCSFFWCFFHQRLAPAVEGGLCWPPYSQGGIRPYSIPLINTCILLSRGIFLTWSHITLLSNKLSALPLILTILLGIFFFLIQLLEYKVASITLSDRGFGTIFFIATGFHGLHIIIGLYFLLICLTYIVQDKYCSWKHLRYEIAIWYWHFVDVVWLFLYAFIYFWGSY